VRPGERRPRRPAGSLTISISDSFRSAKVSDKRGTLVESRLPQFFEKAIAFAREVHNQNEERAASKREHELKEKRRREVELRIERLNRNMAAWQRAEQIRAYAQAMADWLSKGGPIDPESDAAKWLAWARGHADSIDPTRKPSITPQEFWEWNLVLYNEWFTQVLVNDNMLYRLVNRIEADAGDNVLYHSLLGFASQKKFVALFHDSKEAKSTP
jgi:hypothetical protein